MGAKSKTVLVILAGLLALVLGNSFLSKGPTDLFLVAHGSVPVYESESDALKPPASGAKSRLLPLERAQIIECVDVKHYLIYKVHLANGIVGFVNDGKYELIHKGQPGTCR